MKSRDVKLKSRDVKGNDEGRYMMRLLLIERCRIYPWHHDKNIYIELLKHQHASVLYKKINTTWYRDIPAAYGMDYEKKKKKKTCSSLAGFQSGSNIIKRFAPMRFNPQPPALLDSIKTNSEPCIKKLTE